MKNVRLSSKNLTVSVAGLAWPIFVAHAAAMTHPVIDTLMVARFSSTDLAALAVGASIYVSIYIGFYGMMQSLTPTFGQLFGAGEFAEIGQQVQQGVWMAIFLSLIGSFLLFFPAPFLHLANASPELARKATLYLRFLAFGLPALLCFLVYVSLNNAIARPKMVMFIQVSALFLKVPLNFVVIFGWFGFPAMGGPGCGLVSLVIIWIMLGASWAVLRFNTSYHFLHIFSRGIVGPRWKSLKELLRLGVPLGLNYFIEVTSFTIGALLIARIGIEAVGGHQIISNFSLVVYMLPLATANATATLVAQSIGANNLQLARQVAFSGQRLAAVMAIFLSVIIWFSRDIIVSAYTSDPEIVKYALPLLLFVCAYQFFDAIQITSAHILRAHKVVLAPTLLYLISFWGIGLGGGYVFAFDVFNLGLPEAITGVSGFWFSCCLSLVVLATFLLILMKRVERRAAASEAASED